MASAVSGNQVNDETTPLLVASEAGPTVNANADALTPPPPEMEDDTPLPKLQIALICYDRIVEPMAFFCIFPFLNEMIWKTGGLNKANVGFYTGLIESLFSITQMVFMIPWGRASDRLGRKPVLVFSLAGVSCSTALFGFSTKLWQMILFRCLAGVFAGTVITMRAMLSENSTPRTQARAFSWFAFSGNVGIFVGPTIGGLLSNPADQFPRVFGRLQLFKDFPYALPTMITGLFGVSATVITALFLKETLTKDLITANKATPPMTTTQLLKHPGVAPVIVIYAAVMSMALAYTAVMPICLFTDIGAGGMGFSPFQISMFLVLAGVSQALWTILVFPPLQHRIGTGGILRVCAAAWPILMFFWPLCNILLRNNLKTAFWIVMPIANVLGSGVAMSFTAVQLALNDIAPSHATLGTLNAIALTVVSGIRAVAPALFASIFATGVKSQIVWGYLFWVVMIIMAISVSIILRWLPAKAEGRLKGSPAAHED